MEAICLRVSGEVLVARMLETVGGDGCPRSEARGKSSDSYRCALQLMF